MRFLKNWPKLLVLLFAIAASWLLISSLIRQPSGGARVNVVVPDLTQAGKKGQQLFATNCASCHGAKAEGTDEGPTLIHDIYNPGHHADQAFIMAARFGVRQHHWRFGNMPAQPQASEAEVRLIIEFVRELQAANGIRYKPHTM
jgi:mono/diheme cytochrome c family protein